MKTINIPISPGELLDKITILEIKMENMSDEFKLCNVDNELKLLTNIWNQTYPNNKDLNQLKDILKIRNNNLWIIEDKIRIKESENEFDKEFIELARSVYIENDKRASTKRKINELLGSNLIEEKSYVKY